MLMQRRKIVNPLSVTCPYCGRWRGQRCITNAGFKLPLQRQRERKPHFARQWAAVAKEQRRKHR